MLGYARLGRTVASTFNLQKPKLLSSRFCDATKLPNDCFCVSSFKLFRTSACSVDNGFFGSPQEEGLMKRMAKRLGWTETSRSVLNATGYLWYIKVADSIDYMRFFKICGLEDTFVSWFTIVELHLWMVAVRLMEEGEEGKIVRNSMVRAMWEDCDAKSKKLEGALASARKQQIQILGEEFQASLISYDEGLQGPDIVLAGALWRRFLRTSVEENGSSQSRLLEQARALELLTVYVRSEYFRLNQLSREQVLKRRFTFTPFDEKLLITADKVISRASSVG